MSGAWVGTFAAALLGCIATMLALGVGVLFGREPLRGSCGGSCGHGCDRPCAAAPHPSTEERV